MLSTRRSRRSRKRRFIELLSDRNGKTMTTPGNVGKRDTGTREKIIAATLEIMFEEGYAAATSRRVAERAGVQRAVVYYYFPTMDDLFLAVLRRGTQENL